MLYLSTSDVIFHQVKMLNFCNVQQLISHLLTKNEIYNKFVIALHNSK